MNGTKVNRRLTKQKVAILNYLKSTKTHPDAEAVYEALKAENPNISLSTVYRNLAQMSDDGIILKLVTGGKSDHFDGDTSPHQHFICSNCSKILDVMCEISLEDKNIGDISSCCVYFYGLCKECKED